ncbi:IS3 family transposase, partial [Streptomyces sp. MN03-5084-2B]|nr:IS3 family transposase [Streptomyces sp. MN03-5084-2B]
AGITRRKRRTTTRPAAGPITPVADLIRRDFTAEKPGQRLVGDITCLPTFEGWLYLATVIDLAHP